jgi:hypothetical protein
MCTGPGPISGWPVSGCLFRSDYFVCFITSCLSLSYRGDARRQVLGAVRGNEDRVSTRTPKFLAGEMASGSLTKTITACPKSRMPGRGWPG